MRTFVVPDVHGRVEGLRGLLRAAGLLDEDNKRVNKLYFDMRDPAQPELGLEEVQVVSIGDLLNATLVDVNNDSECLIAAMEWFDLLLLGNHEAPYLFRDIGFNGYHPDPALKSQYNALARDGFVRPALVVGETLLSHAGVHAYFDFETAEEACKAIEYVFDNYNRLEEDNEERFYFTHDDGSPIEIPKSLLLNAVSSRRGGSYPFGGMLWADWAEKKNVHFNQIVGHTPIKSGPVHTQYHGLGRFTLNIDCGAKGGLPPWGVFLKEDGRIDHFVHYESQPAALAA